MVLLGEFVAREVFEFLQRHAVEARSHVSSQGPFGVIVGKRHRLSAHALELGVAESGEVVLVRVSGDGGVSLGLDGVPEHSGLEGGVDVVVVLEVKAILIIFLVDEVAAVLPLIELFEAGGVPTSDFGQVSVCSLAGEVDLVLLLGGGRGLRGLTLAR